MDRVREVIRTRHYSPRTERAYVHWIRGYIFFHKPRHNADMGKPELDAILSHLAVSEHVRASTGQIEGVVRGKRPGCRGRAEWLEARARLPVAELHPR